MVFPKETSLIIKKEVDNGSCICHSDAFTFRYQL